MRTSSCDLQYQTRRLNLSLVQLLTFLMMVRTGELCGAAASTVALALEAAAVLTQPARSRANGTKVLFAVTSRDQCAV